MAGVATHHAYSPHDGREYRASRRSNALPPQNQAVDYLQPDLLNSGGITGTKMIADLAALYRIPVCLHNVSGLALNMASQQWSADVFNCQHPGDRERSHEDLQAPRPRP